MTIASESLSPARQASIRARLASAQPCGLPEPDFDREIWIMSQLRDVVLNYRTDVGALLGALDRLNADNDALRKERENLLAAAARSNRAAGSLYDKYEAALSTQPDRPARGSLEELYARAAGQACRDTHEALAVGATLDMAVAVGVGSFRTVIDNTLDTRRYLCAKVHQ